MLKTLTLLASVSFFASSATAAVNIIKTTDYAIIDEVIKAQGIKYSPEDVLLVFDIDNTLLTRGTKLGGDIWYQWQTDKLPNKPGAKERVPCLYDNAITLLYELGPMSLTETQVPALMHQWQQKHTVFALTSRSQDTQTATLRELKRNNIDFSLAPLAETETTVPFEKGRLKRSWLYTQGVFFSSGQDKGVILDFLLKKTGRHFKSAIFVDDGEANIAAIQRMFSAPQWSDMETIGIHYTRIEEALIAKQGAILTPDQTRALTREWETLSASLNTLFPDRAQLCTTAE